MWAVGHNFKQVSAHPHLCNANEQAQTLAFHAACLMPVNALKGLMQVQASLLTPFINHGCACGQAARSWLCLVKPVLTQQGLCIRQSVSLVWAVPAGLHSRLWL